MPLFFSTGDVLSLRRSHSLSRKRRGRYLKSTHQQRRRRLLAEALEPRQMLAGDINTSPFDVRFILTARDLQTDALLPNLEGVSTMTEDSEQVLHYQVPIDEVFKLEVAAQDRRDRGFDNGIFRVVTDIIVESKGVLEPAIGEVQELVFSQDILSPKNSNGTISLYLDSNPGKQVTMTLASFLGVDDAHVGAVLKDAIVQLNDLVTSADQIRTVITQKPEGGPSGGPAYITEVVYKDLSFIGVDMPKLRVNLTIDPAGPVGPTVQPVLENEFNVYIDSDGDGVEDDINPARMYHFFELNNRNVGAGNQSQVWGRTRVVAGFDQSQPGRDIFDEVGGLGPVSSGGIRDGIPDFSGSVAYDAFAIPVRARSLAKNVSVKLDPPDIGDKVLIYGTAANKEEVPANRIQLGGNSRFLLDVLEPVPEVHARDTSRNLDEDAAPITINLSSLVTADPGTLTYTLITGTTLGTTTLDGTKVIYQPNADAFGTETLTYQVTHQSGQFDRGKITFNIAPVPDAPVAIDDSVSTDEDTILKISVAMLLANDTDKDPGDTRTLVSITQPSHGTAVRSGGTITYTPAADYFGSDSFTYTMKDSTGLTSTATVNITVNPINDLPIAVGETAHTEPNIPITFPFAELLANDSAGPLEFDQVLTITSVSAPVQTASTAVIVGDTIVYTPGPDMSARDSFTYTISDGFASATATVSIDVSYQLGPVNVVLPASSSSDITVRRVNSRIEIIDHSNEDALLLRRALNTITALTITGATDAANRITIDHQAGGLITFVGTSSSIDVIGGSTDHDELIVHGVTNASVLISEASVATPSMHDGLIANLQSGTSQSSHRLSGFENVSIGSVQRITVPSNSILDIGSDELHLSSVESVNLSRTTRLNGGTLTSTMPLQLGASESLIGSGIVKARIVSESGSTITATGNLTLGDINFATSIDIAGVLNTGSYAVTLLDSNEAIVRGRITLGASAGAAGSIHSANGMTIQSGGQITGNGTVSTPNNATKPLANHGNISGTSSTAPVIVAGWLTGPGLLSNISISGSWNPSDAVNNRLDGHVNLKGTSATFVDIGGTVAGSSFDRFGFNQGAHLGGVLEVELINGFSPSVGHQFKVIEGTGTLTGEFDSIVLPQLPEGLKWLVDQSVTDLTLRVALNSAELSETIQVKLSATHQIIIMGRSGQDIPVASDTITLEVNPKTQRFDSPEKWTVGDAENIGGRLYQIATNGNATLRIAGAGWTNFIDRFDINRVGGVTAVDALVIINELNAPKFSSGVNSELHDPNLAENFPNIYYDTNGDGRVSAVDALQVINRLIAMENGGAEPLAMGQSSGDLAPTITASTGSNRGASRAAPEPQLELIGAASSHPLSRAASDAVFADWNPTPKLADQTTSQAERYDSSEPLWIALDLLSDSP